MKIDDWDRGRCLIPVRPSPGANPPIGRRDADAPRASETPTLPRIKLTCMSVIAHGIDLVHCPRIARLWKDHGERFLRRVYTDAERAYCTNCKDPVIRLAGRFAAKEAVMKLLGTGWRGGVEWTDIETLPDPLGRPLVALHGKTAELAAALDIAHIMLSISHSGDYAVASAIGTAGSPPRPR